MGDHSLLWSQVRDGPFTSRVKPFRNRLAIIQQVLKEPWISAARQFTQNWNNKKVLVHPQIELSGSDSSPENWYFGNEQTQVVSDSSDTSWRNIHLDAQVGGSHIFVPCAPIKLIRIERKGSTPAESQVRLSILKLKRPKFALLTPANPPCADHTRESSCSNKQKIALRLYALCGEVNMITETISFGTPTCTDNLNPELSVQVPVDCDFHECFETNKMRKY